MEIGNQMQNHKIETNSELIYGDGSIWSTIIFIKIIGSNTLWFPLPPSEVLELPWLLIYSWDFMMSLSGDKQADVIDAFNTTPRYLDDILNIYNVYFDNMVSQIYLSELQLNKANTSDTEK